MRDRDRNMLCFLAGAAVWVLASHTGPAHLFAAGAINGLDLAIMAAALAPALAIARRARQRVRFARAPSGACGSPEPRQRRVRLA